MRKALAYVLAVFFAAAGANHFLHPAVYLKMMPAYLPFPLFLVYLSGFLETAFGLGLSTPRFRRVSAWGLIAMLILIFPANINMAVHPKLFPGIDPRLLWLRLPFQFVLMGLVFWSAGKTPNLTSPAAARTSPGRG